MPPVEPPRRWLTAALSGTPIAEESRFVDQALRPCAPMTHPFDPARHSGEVLEKARRHWLAAMRSEYESASVFIDLATELREIAGPLDVQTVVLRMAQDELRHAAICARVVEAMGGEAKIPAGPLPRALPHPDCGAEESVLREIIYGCCLSELVNVARLAKSVGEVGDPFVRDAFRQLLADERLHAQFGFHYLESRRAWLEAHPEIVRSLGRFLRFAFASLEQRMGAIPRDARPRTEAELAVGLPDPTELSQSFQETILNASVPGLERFGIAASAAWRDRSLTP
ncbi:MAG TPA: ferritin-like domain-containing protein [Polyangia bacterium]|nr:ferritin-like domain-containing protein [Polyangia bacterium]